MAVSMGMDDRIEEAFRFFRSLYPERTKLAQAELHNRGKSNQSFAEGTQRFSLFGEGKLRTQLGMRIFQKADRGVEMFYCPTPMDKDPDGKEQGRKKFQVLPTRVAFSDADYGLTAEAKAKMVELGACLVKSGGRTPTGPKYHIYLRLSRDVTMEELEKINRGLKIYVNGDKFDATSLLRIPGTRNHKYPGSPIVRVERGATDTHTPESLMEMFPVPEGTVSGVELAGLKLPEIPPNFRFGSNAKEDYFRIRREVRNWNGRYNAGNAPHRYAAAVSIVKECIKYGLTVDDAYAFAMHCEPLLDKQAEENGYDIQKDIAKTYYRETKTQTSGLTVEEFTREATASDKPAPKEPKAEDRPTSPVPAFANSVPGSPMELDSSFPFFVPNMDELLAGEYKPLEPTMVSCGSFRLLYPGKSHSLVADRSMGKTHIAIAMVHQILREGGRVAYFDFEDTPDTFIRDRMMNQHGISAEMIRNQFLYIGGSTPEEMESFTHEDAIQYLAKKLKGWDACLVVIDGVSASMGDLDGDWDDSKAVDYKKWHKIMVQPFLDEEIATLQLDHSTKSSPRAGGTMQKGAKLTGVEYQVRQIANHGFTIGRVGKVIIEAVKDRVGRIAKHRRTTPPTDTKSTEEWPWNDVATFTLASDDDGHINQALFEPINFRDTAEHHEARTQPVSDEEFNILRILREAGQPMVKSKLASTVGGNRQIAIRVIDAMVSRGLLHANREGNAWKISPAEGAPTCEPGKATLDFEHAKPMPKGAKADRECRKCREYHTYPDDFAAPHDIGYNPKRPMCKPCAEENIDSEPRDGAEWARGIRERITGKRRPANRRQSS